jgi:hypothetical protein
MKDCSRSLVYITRRRFYWELDDDGLLDNFESHANARAANVQSHNPARLSVDLPNCHLMLSTPRSVLKALSYHVPKALI